MAGENPGIVVRLARHAERKTYRLEYSDAISSWYYISSLIDGRIEKLPSLEHAIARRILVEDEVAELLRQGWSHVPDPDSDPAA